MVGGFRYWHLKSDLTFTAGALPAISASRSRGWVDAVRYRGRARLSKRLFVIGKADLGGGSKFTYQLFGGVGLLMGKRFALIGGYRDLSVNYSKDNFLFDVRLHMAQFLDCQSGSELLQVQCGPSFIASFMSFEQSGALNELSTNGTLLTPKPMRFLSVLSIAHFSYSHRLLFVLQSPSPQTSQSE